MSYSKKHKGANPLTPLQSNYFAGQRAKAIESGKKSFVVNGKEFPVTGDSPALEKCKHGINPKTGKCFTLAQRKAYQESLEAGEKNNEDGPLVNTPTSETFGRKRTFEDKIIADKIAKGGKEGVEGLRMYEEQKKRLTPIKK